MRRPDSISTFSKALLAGALTGIVAASVNSVYSIIFRSITRYFPAEEFGFFQIIFASVIVLILIGILYYSIIKMFSTIAFAIILIILVIAVVCITAFVHANKSETAFYGNHGLIAGFTIISGILSLTLLPYLYRHPKIFI